MSALDASRRQRLAACYERFGFLVFRRCRQILGDEQDARDVTQRLFLRLGQELDRFDEDEDWTSWIYVVATREALAFLRSRKRRLAREERYTLEQSQLGRGPHGEVSAQQLLARLSHQLDEKHQTAAILYFVDGLDQSEIGEVMGTSRRTVIRWLKAVRAAASDLWEDRWTGAT